MKTALVIGATGMTGSNLVELLLKDSRFKKVIIFSRRPAGINNSKIEEHVINYDELEKYKEHCSGDVLFSALGVPIRKAGGREAQYKVDYTYQYEIAKISAENKVANYVLISAANSNPESKIFYFRMKGELERKIKNINFSKIRILKPGLIEGYRDKPLFKEKISILIAGIISVIPAFRKYRPILAAQLAQAMINSVFDDDIRIKEYTWEDLFSISNIK